MRIEIRIAVALIVGVLGSAVRADPDERPYLDIPIHQTINRGGALRYAVWVKVGDRTVEALLDTGSTGLRVLASVMPGDVTGVPTDVTLGGTLRMQGLAILAPIEIGSLKGETLVDVVQTAGCVADRPDCGASPVGGDSFRIGGDAFAHQGYSAILGIGLPFIGTDIGNPLKALGVKRWIVDLPRPFEDSPGHLILDPNAEASRGFAALPRHGKADADGCVEGDFLPEKKCGTVLFDTGAPSIMVFYGGAKTQSGWIGHATGHLSVALDDDKSLDTAFHAGESGGLQAVAIAPPISHGDPEAFILAGVSPFFTYDMLYDEAAHTVALKQRPPLLPPGAQVADGAARGFGDEVVDERYRQKP